MSSILVAYFSASGKTKSVAEKLAGIIGADLFEIKAAVPYTSEDLNFMDDSSRTSVEKHDPDLRPEFVGAVENPDQYKYMFVGFPNWWNKEPNIIDTFLESMDLAGKTIIPFCTSRVGGVQIAAERLRQLFGDTATIDYGARIDLRIAEPQFKNWACSKIK